MFLLIFRDLEDHYGEANCVFCEARYSTTVNHLTKPIDMYVNIHGFI